MTARRRGKRNGVIGSDLESWASPASLVSALSIFKVHPQSG